MYHSRVGIVDSQAGAFDCVFYNVSEHNKLNSTHTNSLRVCSCLRACSSHYSAYCLAFKNKSQFRLKARRSIVCDCKLVDN